ncbi:hypothetical protein BCR36DRAFT_333301, partial [Piromyces finnis]
MILKQSKSSIKRINSGIISTEKGNGRKKTEKKIKDENDNIIITSICNETFTPIYDERTSLEIRGDETEIIRWLSTEKKKGKAIGEIWHRFTKNNNTYRNIKKITLETDYSDDDECEDDDKEIYKDILIGTFELNLDFLVNRAGIANKIWIPINLPKKIVEYFKEKNEYLLSTFKFLGASILISINMDKGFDIGAISLSESQNESDISSNDLSNISSSKTQLAKFRVKVNRVYLPLNNDSENINDETIYIRWASPEINKSKNYKSIHQYNNNNDNKMKRYYSEPKSVESNYNEEEGVVVNFSDIYYNKEIVFEYNTNVIEYFRDRQFEIEVWKEGLKNDENKPFNIYIGSCFIDLYNLVIYNRKYRKRMLNNKSNQINGMYPLVNPESSYMYGSKIDLCIGLNINSRSRNNSYKNEISKNSIINKDMYSKEDFINDMNSEILTTIHNQESNKEDTTEIPNDSYLSIEPSVFSTDIINFDEINPKNKNVSTKNKKNNNNVYYDNSNINSFEIKNKLYGYSNNEKLKSNRNVNTNNIIKNSIINNLCELKIIIERAFHITIPKRHPQLQSITNSNEVIPYVFVTMEWKNGEEQKLYKTEICQDSSPIWNYAFSVKPVVDEAFIKSMQDTALQFKVWYISNKNNNINTIKKDNSSIDCNSYNRYLIGTANIYIKPLLSCVLREIHGWYNIIDDDLNCNGTLGISICPNDAFFHKCKDISNKTNILLENKFSSIMTPLLDSNNKYENTFNFNDNNTLESEFLGMNNIDFKLNTIKENNNLINDCSSNLKNNNDSDSVTNPLKYMDYSSHPSIIDSNIGFMNLKNQLSEKLSELEFIQKDMLSKLQSKINMNKCNNTSFKNSNIPPASQT